MMVHQVVGLYRNVAVESADPVGLVIMAYEGAISAIDRAVMALDEGDFKAKGEEIQKALALVSELMSSLDMEKGGEIARSLSSLYAYFMKRLLIADSRKDRKPLLEVRGHMAQLLDAWRELRGTGLGKARRELAQPTHEEALP
jgi:flagellar protein FliS